MKMNKFIAIALLLGSINAFAGEMEQSDEVSADFIGQAVANDPGSLKLVGMNQIRQVEDLVSDNLAKRADGDTLELQGSLASNGKACSVKIRQISTHPPFIETQISLSVGGNLVSFVGLHTGGFEMVGMDVTESAISVERGFAIGYKNQSKFGLVEHAITLKKDIDGLVYEVIASESGDQIDCKL
jgi:hypothetical protein